jgi:DNA-binding winged helix-turn-helix (wHTH) protein
MRTSAASSLYPVVQQRRGARSRVELHFGDFTLDPLTRQLRRGATGIRISPKAFALLLELVERRPEALTKTALQESLWPGTFVVEANLSNLIAEIRAALEDDVRHPRFIRTVHGFGYAFCGTVSSDPGWKAPRVAATPCVLVQSGRLYPLAEGENVLGREGDAASWFDSTSVSRRHARIVVTGGKALLEDLASKNGTFLGDVRVSAPVPLEDGAEIRLGSLLVTFRWTLGQPSTETQFG